MKHYIGIDLGTTNSAVCSYDGLSTRVWKSPEQNDVTPSAIYMDKRGRKYIGQRAYDFAPHQPDNSATLFKRLMGTSTPIELPGPGLTLTPEECSAEILKALFGYLPEEIRDQEDSGVVVTVPAAFDQMQREATLAAAEAAELGRVALLQEPVAAVMTAMRAGGGQGLFLVYDLGGGTLDVAVAENYGGRISLLAHGGIAMCGGRDFDRAVLEKIVRPWLLENFSLPEKFLDDPQYRLLARLAAWATEKAKMELSARPDSIISLSETEVRTRDLSNEEIYLDIPLSRDELNGLIGGLIDESVAAAREAVAKAGLAADNLSRVVFIGGPTNYKPLRDKVSEALGLPSDAGLNPMTAVAEGAALFAESIDWSSETRGRKSVRGRVSAGDNALSLDYIARTISHEAAIVIRRPQGHPGAEWQVDSLDSGWSSGRLALEAESELQVTLGLDGENTFKIFVFDAAGSPLPLPRDKIVITKTAATVEAIPASHSVGVEMLDSLGGRPVLEYLVRSGDPLPKKGRKIFKAAASLTAGAKDSLNFKLWEGEIEEPVNDNRPVGVLKIAGHDFDQGRIPAGADLECDYEITDAGNIRLEVSVPAIGGTFNSDRNFYSRQESQLDLRQSAALVRHDADELLGRISEVIDLIDDTRLNLALRKIEEALRLPEDSVDPEKTRQARERVLEAKRLLSRVRRDHLAEMRQIELDNLIEDFELRAAAEAKPSELAAFTSQMAAAQRSIDRGDPDFERYLDGLTRKRNRILWRQDGHIINWFNNLNFMPHLFNDRARYDELMEKGRASLKAGDIAGVRNVINELYEYRLADDDENETTDAVNIIRG